MTLLIILTISILLYKSTKIGDKTNLQKHKEYKKELIKMYDLKKFKIKMKHRQQYNTNKN